MTGRHCVVVLCACVLVFLCSISESRKIPKEVDSIDGCKVRNKFYKVGEQWTPKGFCERNTCYKGGVIAGNICPLVRIPEGSNCHLTEEDPSKGWPDCCGTVVCTRHVVREVTTFG